MRASKASSISGGKVSEWRSVFDRHLPVLPEGAAGRPAAARGPAGGGERRAAEPAELRAEAGGPGEGAAQVGRRKDRTLTFFFKYRKAF